MDYQKSATREYFPDGSSYNPATGTITFGITLPAKAVESMYEGELASPLLVLNCLARSIELQTNSVAKSALRAVFDCIYDRTSDRERALFPNWFDSR